MIALARFIDVVSKCLFYVGVLSGIIMTVLILLSTLLRYVVGYPISFSDELAGLLFLCMAFTTFPHVLNRSGHISIDLIVNKLAFEFKTLSAVVAAIIFVAFSMVFIYQSWNFMSFSRLIGSRTDISGILLWPWMAIMPFSMGLCILVELKKLMIKNSASNHGEVEK